MIFYRNPVPGKVKTRLAATMGEERALEIYMTLSAHTREITKKLPVAKSVFYSEEVQSDDMWPADIYDKSVQNDGDLGQRMYDAFSWAFRNKYDAVCIIGTDCYELTDDIISKAFSALRSADVVIGPAMDGGYYLLGMRTLRRDLFFHKQWSTDTVFADTMRDLSLDNAAVVQLPVLRDIDDEHDLPPALKH